MRNDFPTASVVSRAEPVLRKFRPELINGSEFKPFRSPDQTCFGRTHVRSTRRLAGTARSDTGSDTTGRLARHCTACLPRNLGGQDHDHLRRGDLLRPAGAVSWTCRPDLPLWALR